MCPKDAEEVKSRCNAYAAGCSAGAFMTSKRKERQMQVLLIHRKHAEFA